MPRSDSAGFSIANGKTVCVSGSGEEVSGYKVNVKDGTLKIAKILFNNSIYTEADHATKFSHTIVYVCLYIKRKIIYFSSVQAEKYFKTESNLENTNIFQSPENQNLG